MLSFFTDEKMSMCNQYLPAMAIVVVGAGGPAEFASKVWLQEWL